MFAFCVPGYVCERKDLLVNGCCNVNAPSSRQYICKSCLANGCCSIYEYCVSCCLQPDKVIWLIKTVSSSCPVFCIHVVKVLKFPFVSPQCPSVFNQFFQEWKKWWANYNLQSLSSVCPLSATPSWALPESRCRRFPESFHCCGGSFWALLGQVQDLLTSRFTRFRKHARTDCSL